MESTYGRRRKNREAFETCLEVFRENEAGSKMRGSVWAETGSGSRNGATPSRVDFQLDFMLCVRKTCDHDERKVRQFVRHFIFDNDVLTTNQEHAMVQRVGTLLKLRGLFPIGKYFRTVRREIRGTTAVIQRMTAQIERRRVETADVPEIALVQETREFHDEPAITTTDDSTEQGAIHDLITRGVEIPFDDYTAIDESVGV